MAISSNKLINSLNSSAKQLNDEASSLDKQRSFQDGQARIDALQDTANALIRFAQQVERGLFEEDETPLEMLLSTENFADVADAMTIRQLREVNQGIDADFASMSQRGLQLKRLRDQLKSVVHLDPKEGEQ